MRRCTGLSCCSSGRIWAAYPTAWCTKRDDGGMEIAEVHEYFRARKHAQAREQTLQQIPTSKRFARKAKVLAHSIRSRNSITDRQKHVCMQSHTHAPCTSTTHRKLGASRNCRTRGHKHREHCSSGPHKRRHHLGSRGVRVDAQRESPCVRVCA